MKSVLRAVALGAAAFLVFVVVSTPADWVAGRFSGQAPQLDLAGVTGSLWSGNALQVRYDEIALDDVQWHWRPLALFGGRMEYTLTGDWGGYPVSFAAGKALFGPLYLKDVEVRAPLQALTGALRVPVELSGELELALDRVTFTGAGDVPALAGRGRWAPAVTSAPVALDLGTVVLDMAPAGNATSAKVTAQGGGLLIDGTLLLDPTGQYNLTADLTPAAELSEELKSGLNAVAEFRNGRYSLEWAGELN